MSVLLSMESAWLGFKRVLIACYVSELSLRLVESGCLCYQGFLCPSFSRFCTVRLSEFVIKVAFIVMPSDWIVSRHKPQAGAMEGLRLLSSLKYGTVTEHLVYHLLVFCCIDPWSHRGNYSYWLQHLHPCRYFLEWDFCLGCFWDESAWNWFKQVLIACYVRLSFVACWADSARWYLAVCDYKLPCHGQVI